MRKENGKKMPKEGNEIDKVYLLFNKNCGVLYKLFCTMETVYNNFEEEEDEEANVWRGRNYGEKLV